MKDLIKLQGRELAVSDIEFIQRLITTHSHWSRRRLSIELCEAWNWRNAKGVIKDMASRTFLVKLHERGHIQLPPRRQIPSNRMVDKRIHSIPHDTTPIEAPLKQLVPLRVINVAVKSTQDKCFSYLLSQYHYLSYTSAVGENIKYLVLDKQERPLACLLFGASAWACADRDRHVGWDKPVRQRNLNFTTNNTRFLILPWVKVPHLASHILGAVAKRIGENWQQRYGHAVYMLETFVDQSRFKGTCYRAANWIHVGQTQGRSRNDRDRKLSVPIKSIYLYPLVKHYREKLISEL